MLFQIYNRSVTNYSKVLGGMENAFNICLRSGQKGILQDILQLGLVVQSRNTYVFKRTREPRLMRKGDNIRPILTKNAYIYELLEYPSSRPVENIKVILTSYVKGLGQQGDVISVKKNFAYTKLLLPGLADFATPENLAHWSSTKTEKVQEDPYSSIHIERTLLYLKGKISLIFMNKETPWTLEPWHIRTSFRKDGLHVNSDNCIELPPQKIEGPNIDIEGKEFEVTVTINKREKAKVRCRIHHWATNPEDRLPYPEEFWKQPAEKLFPEESKQTTS